MPATEQLNIRVPTTVKDRFRTRARREGLSQAALLEALLNQRGRLTPEDVRETMPREAPVAIGDCPPAAGTSADASLDTVSLSTWLSGRLGMPKVLMARAIAAGRVTVAGVPWTADLIEKRLLETVSLDGAAVIGPS